MRRIVALLFTASACQFAFAEQPPVVGLWEQLAAGNTGGSSTNAQRVDIVFADQKIEADTQFSGLADAGTKATVLCCVKVSKSALITLPVLLKKYPWDPDTADHIKKITGWKYIYEARVVDSSQQSADMRKLVDILSAPPALSPYSAPVIAGKIPGAEIDKKFKIGNTDVTYSLRASQDTGVISYKFLINGKPVTLTEVGFPD